MADGSTEGAQGTLRPSVVTPVSMSDLAAVRSRYDGGESRTRVVGDGEVTVTGITASSSGVREGDLFAALPGARAHGAKFAADAVARGAVAVLTDDAGLALVPDDVPVLVVPDVRLILGPISARVFGNPANSVRMLGVTGTSGKTTTTFLVRAGFAAAGRKPGLIGTVATLIGDEEIPAAFTTPEAPDLQALLAVMVERGVTDVVMEVSSHALTMRRVDGMGFDVAAFTNLSEDHLDFHADMAEYFGAKMRLFELTDDAVIVRDDKWGELAVQIVGACTTVGTIGEVRGNSWEAHDVDELGDGSTTFHVLGPTWAGSRLDGVSIEPRVEFDMGCAIPGRYNVANAVLAVALLYAAGVDVDVAAPAVSAASVPGRMERVDAGQAFLAVVDYSHKPAAVEGALRALRPLTTGKLIIVLGCGGDRDRGKRPHMGEIAARDADLLIVTDDNPRSEDPADIRRAMLDGALVVPEAERANVLEVAGRADAIGTAVAWAEAGDTVLIAGKGHETGQEIAGIKHPFDDRLVLRTAIGHVG